MSTTPHVLRDVAAVLLDLDGVLVDSSPAVERHWRAFADRCAVDPHAILGIAHGRPSRDVIGTFVADVTSHLAWFEALEATDTEDVTALVGADHLLDRLPAERWAVVTSGGRAVATARLLAAGLPLPNVLVTADDVHRGKPDPEGYRLASTKLAAGQAAVAFEDSPAGIEAARGAGCIVVGVATTHDPAELHADLVVRSLADVEVHVGTWLDLSVHTVAR
jgi:sugar-phosphatase